MRSYLKKAWSHQHFLFLGASGVKQWTQPCKAGIAFGDCPLGTRWFKWATPTKKAHVINAFKILQLGYTYRQEIKVYIVYGVDNLHTGFDKTKFNKKLFGAIHF